MTAIGIATRGETEEAIRVVEKPILESQRASMSELNVVLGKSLIDITPDRMKSKRPRDVSTAKKNHGKMTEPMLLRSLQQECDATSRSCHQQMSSRPRFETLNVCK